MSPPLRMNTIDGSSPQVPDSNKEWLPKEHTCRMNESQNIGVSRFNSDRHESTTIDHLGPVVNAGVTMDQLGFHFGDPDFAQAVSSFDATPHETAQTNHEMPSVEIGALDWSSRLAPMFDRYTHKVLNRVDSEQLGSATGTQVTDDAKSYQSRLSPEAKHARLDVQDVTPSGSPKVNPTVAAPEASQRKTPYAPSGTLPKAKRGRPKKKATFRIFANGAAADSSPASGATIQISGIPPDVEEPLPDYSNTQLSFRNQQEAWKGCMQNLASRDTAWTPPNNDPSIPVTADQRENVVRQLLGAMLDTSHCMDAGGKTFQKRWGSGKSPYDVRDMEKVCWDIELLVERMHKEGPQILSIYDPTFLRVVKRTKDFTFDNRIRWLVKLLSSFKSRVDSFIKGDAMMHTVAQPQEAYASACSNLAQNRRRQQYIDFGKKAQKAAEDANNTDQTPITPHDNDLNSPKVIARDLLGDDLSSPLPSKRLPIGSSPTNPPNVSPSGLQAMSTPQAPAAIRKRERKEHEEEFELRRHDEVNNDHKRTRI